MIEMLRFGYHFVYLQSVVLKHEYGSAPTFRPSSRQPLSCTNISVSESIQRRTRRFVVRAFPSFLATSRPFCIWEFVSTPEFNPKRLGEVNIGFEENVAR